ncbi:DUF5819 family protein [Flavobacteriaceae bacterium M23B6Z8]
MKKLFVVIFILHFLLVSIAVLFNVHLLPGSMVTDISKIYTTPFFEQNWGMFSNPPTTTRRVYFQFFELSGSKGQVEVTDWYDVNSSMYRYNDSHYFSVAQRLIKFESGCLNSMFKYIDECKDPTPDQCIEFSPGFISLKNYARILYANSRGIQVKEIKDVKFVIKIIEEIFPRYEDRRKDFSDKKNYDFAEHTTIPYVL